MKVRAISNLAKNAPQTPLANLVSIPSVCHSLLSSCHPNKMKWTKFAFLAFFGVMEVILANRFPYTYWRPESEVSYQPFQPISYDRQDSGNPIVNAIGKFLNGIQSRQFAAGIAPVSFAVFKIPIDCPKLSYRNNITYFGHLD